MAAHPYGGAGPSGRVGSESRQRASGDANVWRVSHPSPSGPYGSPDRASEADDRASEADDGAPGLPYGALPGQTWDPDLRRMGDGRFTSGPRRRAAGTTWGRTGMVALIAFVALLAALVVAVTSGLRAGSTDGLVRTGSVLNLTLPADQVRLLSIPLDAPAQLEGCTVRDLGHGGIVLPLSVADSSPSTTDAGEWEPVLTFRTGSGDLEVTCESTGAPIDVRVSPDFFSFPIAAGAIVVGAASLVTLLWLPMAGVVRLAISSARARRARSSSSPRVGRP